MWYFMNRFFICRTLLTHKYLRFIYNVQQRLKGLHAGMDEDELCVPELPAVCTSLNQNGFLRVTYLSGAAYKCDIPPTAQLYLTLSNMYHIRILPSNRHVNSIQSHTAHARPHLKAAAAYSSYSSCCGTMLASQIESNWVEWNHMFSHLTHPKLHVTLRQRMLNLLQLPRHLKQMLTAFTAAFHSYF